MNLSFSHCLYLFITHSQIIFQTFEYLFPSKHSWLLLSGQDQEILTVGYAIGFTDAQDHIGEVVCFYDLSRFSPQKLINFAHNRAFIFRIITAGLSSFGSWSSTAIGQLRKLTGVSSLVQGVVQ